MFENIRLRPDQEGTRVVLHDLEADIMDEVWSRNWDAFSVRDALEILQEGRDIAYTTVMTTVKRLFDKGLLDRHKEGRRYIYRPVLGREEFHAQMAVEVMRSLPESGRDVAMSLLVDELEDTGALSRLEELIAAKKEQGERDE